MSGDQELMLLDDNFDVDKCPVCGKRRLFGNNIVSYYECGLRIFKVGEKFMTREACPFAMEIAMKVVKELRECIFKLEEQNAELQNDAVVGRTIRENPSVLFELYRDNLGHFCVRRDNLLSVRSESYASAIQATDCATGASSGTSE